eukprot:scaffold1954_cov268-Pinguiococcus_pyrenoidosus.AAC.79
MALTDVAGVLGRWRQRGQSGRGHRRPDWRGRPHPAPVRQLEPRQARSAAGGVAAGDGRTELRREDASRCRRCGGGRAHPSAAEGRQPEQTPEDDAGGARQAQPRPQPGTRAQHSPAQEGLHQQAQGAGEEAHGREREVRERAGAAHRPRGGAGQLAGPRGEPILRVPPREPEGSSQVDGDPRRVVHLRAAAAAQVDRRGPRRVAGEPHEVAADSHEDPKPAGGPGARPGTGGEGGRPSGR